MTLKSLFFAVKSQKLLSDRRLCPSVICLGCIGLFSTGPKLNNFWEKTFAVGSSSLPHSKILVELLLVTFTAADWFFKQFFEPRTKRVKKHCRPYASLFSDIVNIKFFEIAHNLEPQNIVFMLKSFIYFRDPHFRLEPPHVVCSGDGTMFSQRRPILIAPKVALFWDLICKFFPDSTTMVGMLGGSRNRNKANSCVRMSLHIEVLAMQHILKLNVF